MKEEQRTSDDIFFLLTYMTAISTADIQRDKIFKLRRNRSGFRPRRASGRSAERWRRRGSIRTMLNCNRCMPVVRKRCAFGNNAKKKMHNAEYGASFPRGRELRVPRFWRSTDQVLSRISV